MDIKQYLDRTGIPRIKFSKEVGISPSSLYRYESLKMEPSLSMAQRIIDASHDKITFKALVEPWMKRRKWIKATNFTLK